MSHNWTTDLVFKQMNRWVFEGIQPNWDDKVIADKLLKLCPELQFHHYPDVVESVKQWKDLPK